MERRRSERVRCRLVCDIEAGGECVQGQVLDISEGGLCVRSPQQAEQGEALRIVIHSPASPIHVEALVWHSRLVKPRDSKDTFWVLGLMLSKASDVYFDMVPRATRKAEPSSAADPEASRADDGAELRSFRVRVKHRSGPRTCVVSLSAESEDQLRSLVAKDLADWEILEVQA